MSSTYYHSTTSNDYRVHRWVLSATGFRTTLDYYLKLFRGHLCRCGQWSQRRGGTANQETLAGSIDCAAFNSVWTNYITWQAVDCLDIVGSRLDFLGLHMLVRVLGTIAALFRFFSRLQLAF